jgi:hypothetical protein
MAIAWRTESVRVHGLSRFRGRPASGGVPVATDNRSAMDLPPGARVTSDAPLNQAGMLRRAWADVAATVAPQLADLSALLDARLADLEAAGRLDEPSLLAVAEDASQYAMEQGAGDVARTLSKRLRRSIYEFLLALDAVNPAELANAPVVPPPTSPFAPPPEAPAPPRAALTIAPADVSGADDVAAAAVPLWEQVSRPEAAREVYRVASRDVIPADAATDDETAAAGDVPIADILAADAAEIAELAAQIAEPEAEAVPLGEWLESDDTEAIEELVAESSELDLESIEPEGAADLWDAEAAATELDPSVWGTDAVAAEPDVVVDAGSPVEPASWDEPDTAASPPAEIGAAAAETAEVATTAGGFAEPAAPADAAAAAPVGAAGALDADDAAPAEDAVNGTAAAPDQDAAPVDPGRAVANGVRPHRDLLRVPRQFRRLPPLAPHEAPVPDGAELPPAAGPTAASAAPDTPSEDDDALGVPALPWPADSAAPRMEAPAADPDEELGVPFAPLADAHALAGAAPEAPSPQPAPQVSWHPEPPRAASNRSQDAFSHAPAAAPFPIAPREGFHLTDPGALDMALAAADSQPAAPENPFTAAVPPVRVPPQVHAAPPAAQAQAHPQPQEPAAAAPAADAADDSGTWRVRQSPRAALLAERMAQKRREEAARAAFEAATVQDERAGRKKRRGGEEQVPDLAGASRQVNEHLRKKRGAEAAALLQRLAQALGGRDIADLALDAGDRCRALGQSRSATNCYLAAWRADPLYETPLWRLSDICLNDQEIELAVGYLERIAELMRSRGDDEGAIGVYRKIAMIAPERQDVRDVIRLAKTTGRLDA